MKVLVITGSFAPAVKAGGPAIAVTNLVREMSSKHEITVVTSDRDLGDTVAFPGLSGRFAEFRGAKVYYLDHRSIRQQVALWTQLAKESFDALIVNSMWSPSWSLLPTALKRLGFLKASALVLMPRGELEAGALHLKARKKRLAGPVIRRLYRSTADFVAATSPSELSNSKDWFPLVPALMTTDASDLFTPDYTEREGAALRVLCVGRVHPTKGILELIQALNCAGGELKLQIAGPVQDADYWSLCEQVAQELPPGKSIEYLGVVPRERIADLYSSSDLLASLTAGENFGHTIAEGMQVGCPVLITDTTLWTDVVLAGGGSVVPDRSDRLAVARVLSEWCALDDNELKERRRRACHAFAQWHASRPPNVLDLLAAQRHVSLPEEV